MRKYASEYSMALKPLDEMEYHPISEHLVKILQTKTQNTNPLFFQVLVAYYFGLVAAQMRASIAGWAGKGTIPINVYAFNLSPSGTGKGHSTSVMENEVLHQFREVFTEETFPIMAEQNLERLAIKRATRNGTDVNDELEKVRKDFNSLGSLMFSFDSATAPAIKQMRQKLLMANAGACNMQIDEIGANFSASIEALTTYLELFDKGRVKDKLVKSTADNVRFEKIEGVTPSNLLLFGSPSKLLDGSNTEAQLMDMLETGYARRCFFGFARKPTKVQNLTAAQIKAQLYDKDTDNYLEQISERLGMLANMVNVNKIIQLPEESALYLIEYKIECEKRSSFFNDSEVIKRSEMEHRYFKVLKLAGAYAFIDHAPEITTTHLEAAIKLAEESGKAFVQLMTPERSYVKLARYLAQVRGEVTLADLDEDLPSFRGSRTQKEEMITMAIAWGYKNNIIIKKAFVDGILFLHGETIEKTNTDKMILSYGTHEAYNYVSAVAPLDKLSKLLTSEGYHWINHSLVNGDLGTGHRNEENCIQGFNLLVLDVDGTVNLSTAQMLLRDYHAIYYTTKRHTETENRFRILLPMNYTLKMDAKDYKEFYANVVSAIPFEVDVAVGQRCKKWLSNNGQIFINEGELFDVLPFIPKTSKNEERERLLQDQQALDNLERWMINNTGAGNRSNMLIRYALILVDAGFDFDGIRLKVLELNNKLPDKLDELEVTSTILQTTAKALAKRNP